MVQRRKRGVPSTATASRLEAVRQRRGVGTLQEFVDRLTEGGYDIDYTTARRYHRDREAPAHYLARVAEVFNFELWWLVTGRGFPAVEDRQEAEDEAQQNLPDWAKDAAIKPVPPEDADRYELENALRPRRPKARSQKETEKEREFGALIGGLGGTWIPAKELAALHEVAKERYVPELMRSGEAEAWRVFQDVGRAAAAPLEALGIAVEDLEDGERRTYLRDAAAFIQHLPPGRVERTDA